MLERATIADAPRKAKLAAVPPNAYLPIRSTVGLLLTSVAACLLVPALFYAAVVWYRLGEVSVSAYLAYEELLAAWRSSSPSKLLSAPVLIGNFSSTHAVSAMYMVSVGQLCFAALFSTLFVSWMTGTYGSCAKPRRASAIAAVGPAASAGGVTTMLAGCCGGGVPGAAIALAGVSTPLATSIASVFVYTQFALLALMAILICRQRWIGGRAALWLSAAEDRISQRDP